MDSGVNIPAGEGPAESLPSVQDDRPAFTEEETLARAVEAVGAAGFVPRAMDYLCSIAPFRGCFVTMLDGNRPPVHVYDNVQDARRSEVIDRYLDGAYLLDPFVVAYRRAKPCAVLSLRDVAPDRFQQSTYFRQYYQTVRLKDEAAVLIDLPNGRHLFWSIGRLRDERRFSAADLRGLRRILPVFAALNRRHFANSTYGADGGGIETAMDRFGAGVLTEREREIAILVLKGHSSKSIAAEIGVSPGTVKIHRKNFYRKLGISSQSELFSAFLASLSGGRTD